MFCFFNIIMFLIKFKTDFFFQISLFSEVPPIQFFNELELFVPK